MHDSSIFDETIIYPRIGRIDRTSPSLEALIERDAPIEKLADGFIWSEGPVWIPERQSLFFSDVPANRMYRWSEREGISLYLSPSGYEGSNPLAFREPGSNGLIRGPDGTILMADHGNRAIARLDLDNRRKTFLATHYQGKHFNSPNDLVQASNGAIYFTDPPYGLEGLNDSPLKELPFNGVFRLDPDGTVSLLEAGLSFPNGVVLSPDERTLYVSNSDPKRAVIMAYSLDPEGGFSGRRIFKDMTALVGDARPGVPDGMAVDMYGNVFATGPGGIAVLARDGSTLGLIATGTAIANCAFGGDGSTLYIASHMMLARLSTRTRGLGFPASI
jgi:gluconolactonase